MDLDLETGYLRQDSVPGKSFHCISRVHELFYDEKKKKSVFTAESNKSAKEFLRQNKEFANKFLIGDPFLSILFCSQCS